MLKEPPVVHAVSLWDEEARCARYQYNGRDVLTVSISGTDDVKYRLISDGNIQSDPFIQQVYLLVDGEAEATVRLEMTDDAVNMRPHRAEHEQAIVGQNGRPLIKGINGVYDRNEDLLISWFGRPWQWNSHMFTSDGSGKLVAEMTVKLSGKPWTVNFYPQYYRMHLGYRFHEPWKYRPNGHTPAGWCSWEAYRRDITEDNVKDAAAFCAEKFKPYGFDYIQVDDGFQCMPVPHDPKKSLAENWLETNERFPSGHAGICRVVKEQGLKPGIWMSASVFNKQFSEMNKNMFLKDEQGKVLDGKWIHYALDCEAETLAATVKPLYEGLRTAGYEYVKTDQIRHLLYDGLHEMVRRGLMTNDEARTRFRRYMEAAREGLGRDIYYLASWGVLPEVVGMVDACRIATDANPTWPKVRMQIVESGRWFHTQRILFVNDPDHICARTRPEWAQTMLSLVSLSGGLFMLSDPIDAYDEQRVRMIQKCLPPLPTVTAETGELDMHYSAFPWTKAHGFEYTGEVENTGCEINDDDAFKIAGESRTIRNNHPHSSLWAFHFANGIGQWCVALRIATVPLKASLLNISDCALDTNTEYLVFDFWAQRFMGIASETLELPALKLGECQVLCFREVKSHPQFLASSRHVSMGAVSVKSQEWKDKTLTVLLEGVPGTTETYWFDCTSLWLQTAIEGDGAEIKQDHAPCGVLALDVTFNKPQAQVAIQWKKRRTQHA